MSGSEAAHPDPIVVPQEPKRTKGDIEARPSLRNVPKEVKTTITKADEIILRISKLIKTTAGLGAGLSVLQYAIYIAAYLHLNAPTRAAVIGFISRLVGRTPSVASKTSPAAVAATSFLTPLGALVSDTRSNLRLTGLIPLYLWYKTLLSKKSRKEMDPALHRVALLQCSAYFGFQLVENIYTLATKGVLPMSLIEKNGGAAKWVAWSCRAWLVGVASDFLRLLRDAEIEKKKVKTAKEREDYDRKWWAEFMTAAYWIPVAGHYSLFPAGIPGMNNGLVGVFGVMAGLNNFRTQWAATA